MSTSGESRCCPLGSNCVADSQCNSESYYCARTVAATLQASAAVANATETGCCGRSCPQARYFLCPTALGGNCCPYGSECRADGNCVASASSPTITTTGTASGSPTVLCPRGSCAGTATPRGGGGELSSTTRTGIAVTVVAGTGVVVGMLVWLWMTRRRRSKARAAAATTTTASREESSVSEVPGGGVTETAGYFGIGGAAMPSGAARAVPSQPDTPGDIASPVEIDSAAVQGEEAPPRAEGVQMVEERGEVYELPGTEVEIRAGSSRRSSRDEGGGRDKETLA